MNITIERTDLGDYVATSIEEGMAAITFNSANKSKVILTKRWLERLARMIFNWAHNFNRPIRRVSQLLWSREGEAIQDPNASRIAAMMRVEEMVKLPHEEDCEHSEMWNLFMERVHVIATLYDFIIHLKVQELDSSIQVFNLVVERKYEINDRLNHLMVCYGEL